MKGQHRFFVHGLGLIVALSAAACGDDEPGSTTQQGGTAGSGGSGNKAGSLNIGGSAAGAGGNASAGRGGNPSGGAGAQNGGSSSSGAPTAGSDGQGGTIDPGPESAGNIAVKIDGQQVTFDQCRVVRGIAEGDLSVDCRLKSGGSTNLDMSLSFTGLGTIDCVNNQMIYRNAQSMSASATANTGSCSVTATALPAAKDELFNATFSATLVNGGTSVMLTDGTIAIKAAN